MKALNIRVSGLVQGVYFRASTKKKAEELGLVGWCKNEPDSTVSIHVEGQAAELAKMLAWCHTGPQMARVDKLIQSEVEVEGFTEFLIRR